VVDKEFYLLVMSAFVVSKCTPLNQLPARCPPRMGQLDGLDMTARTFSLRRTSICNPYNCAIIDGRAETTSRFRRTSNFYNLYLYLYLIIIIIIII
jgi:hypothetical protein